MAYSDVSTKQGLISYRSEHGFGASAEGWFGPNDMTQWGAYAIANQLFDSPEDMVAAMSPKLKIAEIKKDGWWASKAKDLTDVDLHWICGGNSVYFNVAGKMGNESIFDDWDGHRSVNEDCAEGAWDSYLKDTRNEIASSGMPLADILPEIVARDHLMIIRENYEPEGAECWSFWDKDHMDEISYKEWSLMMENM